MVYKTFKLHSDCIPIMGEKYAAIYDLGRELMLKVPHSLIHFVNSYQGRPLDSIQHLEDDQRDIINDYLDELIKLEVIFWLDSDEFDLFPILKDTWVYPTHLLSAIVNYNGSIDYTIPILDINNLGCQYYQILVSGCLTDSGWEKLQSFLVFLFNSAFNLNNVEIVFFQTQFLIEEKVFLFLRKFFEVRNVYFFNAIKDDNIDVGHLKIAYLSKANSIFDKQSNVSHQAFYINYPFYFEARHYNSNYNQKLYIDTNGDMKNSPTTDLIFGNISTSSIREITSSDEFRALWFVTKDQIFMCNICEFRYICLDNRPLSFNKNKGIYDSKYECNYNPVLGAWSEGGISN